MKISFFPSEGIPQQKRSEKMNRNSNQSRIGAMDRKKQSYESPALTVLMFDAGPVMDNGSEIVTTAEKGVWEELGDF